MSSLFLSILMQPAAQSIWWKSASTRGCSRLGPRSGPLAGFSTVNPAGMSSLEYCTSGWIDNISGTSPHIVSENQFKLTNGRCTVGDHPCKMHVSEPCPRLYDCSFTRWTCHTASIHLTHTNSFHPPPLLRSTFHQRIPPVTFSIAEENARLRTSR